MDKPKIVWLCSFAL